VLRWQYYLAQVLACAATPGVTVLGHVEAYLPLAPYYPQAPTFAGRIEQVRALAEEYIPLSWYEQLGAIAAKHQVAIELHGMSGTPRPQAVRILHQAGVKFSIGSDSHQLVDIGRLQQAAAIAAAAELQEEDFAWFVHDTP